MAKKVKVNLPEYIDIQQEADELVNENRFTVLLWGRRSGKTSFMVLRAIKDCLNISNWKLWICAPSYQAAKRSFDMFQNMIPEDLLERLNRSSSDMHAEFKNGSSISWHTTSSPKGLVGEGLSMIMIDEAAMVDLEVWEMYLRPSLSDTMGKAIFASRPEGINWFKDFYNDAQEKEDWATMQIPSFKNPYFPEEEWDKAQDLPQEIFKQEYMAQFPSAGSDIFPNLKECIKPEHPLDGAEPPFFVGIDPGRQQDYFSTVALDRYGKVVLAYREKGSSWPILIKNNTDKIKELPGNAYCMLDATGLGGPIEDRVRSYGINNLETIVINNPNVRTDLIRNVIWVFDDQEIMIPSGENGKFEFEGAEHFKMLKEELMALEVQKKRSTERYEPSQGFHDDLCLSLSYAVKLKKDRERSYTAQDLGNKRKYKIERKFNRKFNIKENHVRYK